MRVFRLAFAGVLALTIPMAAHPLPFGSSLAPAAPSATPNIVKVWGGCGWGWHPVPGHWSQWRGGWVPPHCAPNRYGGGRRGPYGGWGDPYRGWGVYGSGSSPYGGWRHYGSGWGYP
jgi:hypothetical protein